jgi:putative membrane protein
MEMILLDSLPGFVDFLIYFNSALVLLLVFCGVYCCITPYSELRLIREGNVAAAISLGGALIGFVLPLASVISHSIGVVDMLIWGTIAMAVQISIFEIVRLIFKDLVREIENNHTAAATLLAFFSIVIGILNAASVTY